MSGITVASLLSRAPGVRDALGISSAQFGLLLLCVSGGAMVGLPLSGPIVHRFGPARTVLTGSLTVTTGLVTLAAGMQVGVVGPAAVGLVLVGLGIGVWDVAMNVEGAAVEQRLDRSVMPKFHAGFSVGTVLGALLGVMMVATHVSVTAHLLAVAVLVVAIVPRAVRGFLPATPVAKHHDAVRRSPLAAWTERRTVLIGVFVLCMAFTEGTGNDWLGIAMIDGHDAAPAIGTLTLALFLASMTGGRWFGSGVIDRFGRVPVLRASALTAFIGLMLVVFGHYLAVAVAGSVLWGLGAALGFPSGMSAAADDPMRAAGRVSVVSSVGYTAFLTGPPLIGFLGDHVGVLKALTVAAGLLALAALLAGQCGPVATQGDGRD
ncbi:MAG: MFS transporter [Pseudonocardiales bacterium]|nr:MAG: MFS transporter [Pseudonocardiales bacterium]